MPSTPINGDTSLLPKNLGNGKPGQNSPQEIPNPADRNRDPGLDAVVDDAIAHADDPPADNPDGPNSTPPSDGSQPSGDPSIPDQEAPGPTDNGGSTSDQGLDDGSSEGTTNDSGGSPSDQGLDVSGGEGAALDHGGSASDQGLDTASGEGATHDIGGTAIDQAIDRSDGQQPDGWPGDSGSDPFTSSSNDSGATEDPPSGIFDQFGAVPIGNEMVEVTAPKNSYTYVEADNGMYIINEYGPAGDWISAELSNEPVAAQDEFVVTPEDDWKFAASYPFTVPGHPEFDPRGYGDHLPIHYDTIPLPEGPGSLFDGPMEGPNTYQSFWGDWPE